LHGDPPDLGTTCQVHQFDVKSSVEAVLAVRTTRAEEPRVTDGSWVLRIDDLSTSNGPALHIRPSDARSSKV